jgi:hypothetical protein
MLKRMVKAFTPSAHEICRVCDTLLSAQEKRNAAPFLGNGFCNVCYPKLMRD